MYANLDTLKKIKRRTLDVSIPLLLEGSDDVINVDFRLQSLFGDEREEFELAQLKVERYKDEKGAEQTRREVEFKGLKCKLVSLCWIDSETGLRVCDDAEKVNSHLPADALDRLFSEAQSLNGLNASAVETAQKNSASAPAGASPSDLH